jgi:hypothetical protein
VSVAEIVLLAAVGLHIEQLPRLLVAHH